MRLTASEIAAQFGLTVVGDGATEVSGVATLAHAGTGQLSFLANPRYRPQLAETQASVVILRADDAESAQGTALVAETRTPHSPRSPRYSMSRRCVRPASMPPQ